MPHLRLIGLVLFTTAILLALAAAATKTTHIRIQTGTAALAPMPNPVVVQSELPPGRIESTAVQFTSIPVVWPLLAAAATGLLLWFIQPPQLGRRYVGKSHRRRR